MSRILLLAAMVAGFLSASTFGQSQPIGPPSTPPQAGAQGGAEPGYLGMVGDERQDAGKGVRLKEVFPGSPAADAGLQKDDLITSINGQPIHSLAEMAAIMQPQSAGAHVVFEAQRNGTARTFDVMLGRRPSPDQRRFPNFGRLPDTAPSQPSAEQPSAGAGAMPGTANPPRLAITGRGPLLGVRTLPVTDQDRLRLRLPAAGGAHVVGRSLGSPAERANIPLDSVITAINGQAVGSPGDLSALLAQAGVGQSVEVTYVYNGASVTANITLAAMPGSMPIGPQATGPIAGGNAPPPVPRDLVGPPTDNSIGPRANDLPQPRSNPAYGGAPGQSDAERIEALERRVRELEQKIEQLEGRPQRGA